MKNFIFILFLSIVSCSKTSTTKEPVKTKTDNYLTISLGSCNNQIAENVLFKEILKNEPKVFIWGGDIIYSDTDNPKILETNFKKFKQDSVYQDFASKINVLGTWDDHDFGINDGGTENPIKKEAQTILQDFLDIPKEDISRETEGVYYSRILNKGNNSVKIILLDTRYFRTELTKSPTNKRRYVPNEYGEGTILGAEQWQWLENELTNSKADFNVIVSSIQFLSNKHGFETWGNMPHEVDKLKNLILKTQAEKVVLLSGDRHISEISKTNIGKFKYPLVDFTSSGLTHVYSSFSGEKNPFRVSNVVYEINFGLVKFDFDNNKVLFEIRGKDNVVLEQFTQEY